MKIFNNSSSGSGGGSGGGSGIGENIGDVFFTYKASFNEDPKVVDITYSAFRAEIDEYPDLGFTNVQMPATIAGLKKTLELNNANLPYPYQLYEFKDYFLFAGNNIFASGEFLVCKVMKGDWQIERNIIPVTGTNKRCIFDGTENFYIYTKTTDGTLINSAVKYNYITKTITNLTLKNKRIAKAYYANDIQKFVVFEVNAADANDYDTTKNGIFFYDEFDEVKEVADMPITKYTFEGNIYKFMRRFENYVLRRKDGSVVYVDDVTYKIKDFTTDAEIFGLVGQDGTVNNITEVTSIYELYDKLFVNFADKKDTVDYFASACLKGSEVLHAYAYNIPSNSRTMIYDKIFNGDFTSETPFAPAVIYTTSSFVRQALVFGSTKEKQILMDNISSVAQPSGSIVQAIQYDYSDDDYYSVYTKVNDDLSYRMFDQYGFMGHPTFAVINLKFNGFGVPDIYIPAFKLDGFLSTKLIIKK